MRILVMIDMGAEHTEAIIYSKQKVMFLNKKQNQQSEKLILHIIKY